MTYRELKEQVMKYDKYYVNENPFSVFIYHKSYKNWCVRISKTKKLDLQLNYYRYDEDDKYFIDTTIQKIVLELINTPLRERGGVKTVMAFESEEW